jgi:hypothetical protein
VLRTAQTSIQELLCRFYDNHLKSRKEWPNISEEAKEEPLQIELLVVI